MGWYHVNRIGKGICLGDVDKIHYNEDFIAKHTPIKAKISGRSSRFLFFAFFIKSKKM